jgi:hypothetical protein
MENNEIFIDRFLRKLNSQKKKMFTSEKNEKLTLFYNESENRCEDAKTIIWDFLVDDIVITITYYKETLLYNVKVEQNENINLIFIDNDWLAANNLKFDGNLNLDEDHYILETTEYLFVLLFGLGISTNTLMLANTRINDYFEKKRLLKKTLHGNFIDRFIKYCKELPQNHYECPTEGLEPGDVKKVVFEYSSKTIDDDYISWVLTVKYNEKNKDIESSRTINFDIKSKTYFVDTDATKRFADYSILDEEWLKLKNTNFDGEFCLQRDRIKLDDKIFRLETTRPDFAVMVALGVEYDFLTNIEK